LGIADLTAPLRRPESRTFTIRDLIDEAQRGRIRVPHFQRPLVWGRQDVLDLFDSIWRGFPIGTLLLWAKAAPAQRISFGPIHLEAPEQTDALWVVDGQQRLTTLIACLSDLEGETADPLFDVCFDLRRQTFVHSSKRPVPAHWLPVRVTLQSSTLVNWIRNADSLKFEELDLADSVAGAIRDYIVPAYIVHHDDEQSLRDVFDRVNSAGKPLTRAQVFHALFGGREDTASAASVLERLAGLGFGDIDEQRVIQSLLAIRGGDVARDFHQEFGDDEDRAEWFDRTAVALRRSVEFIQSVGVPHVLLAPSTFPLPVLAAFFQLHPEPDANSIVLLRRWLWRGWVHGYGTRGQTPALRQAIRAVHPTQGVPEDAPSAFDAVRALLDLVTEEPPPGFDGSSQTNSAAGRLALLALVYRGPLGPDNEPIDVSRGLNEAGVRAIAEIIPGHRSRLEARGFWPLNAGRVRGNESDAILRSHLISGITADALRSDDIEGALKHRHEDIATVLQPFLEARLDNGRPVAPPINSLFVPDEERSNQLAND